MEEGDVFVVKTPGGGGYGDPLKRPPTLVLQDVKNGLVSLNTARRDYGIVINPHSMKIDWASTKQLRRGQAVNHT